MVEPHDLAGPYALDALDADERAAFERHMDGCTACQREVGALLAAAAEIGEGAAVSPPPRLKAAVMEAIGGVEAPGSAAAPWYRRWWPRAVAAAVAAVVVAVLATSLVADDPSVSDVFAAPDAASIELAGDGFAGRFTFSAGERLGVFESDTLPSVGDEAVYQLWLIDEEGVPSPAGLFTPDDDGASSALVTGVRTGLVLGLTVEPAGGSAQPTGEVLLAGAIG